MSFLKQLEMGMHMKVRMKLIGTLLVALLIAGCNSSEVNGNKKNEETPKVDVKQKEEASNGDKKKKEKAAGNDEYPMPILSGWTESEITFETIGNGSIDIWHGEFSFEGEIDDYFEPYQAALVDMGFEVTVTEDVEGMKSLEISKVIEGDKHVGNVLFTNRWVKSSLQHFK